jgi:hypothetical protein
MVYITVALERLLDSVHRLLKITEKRNVSTTRSAPVLW